jgi:hypothetical protein
MSLIYSRVLIRHLLTVFLPLSALVEGVVGAIYYQQVQTELAISAQIVIEKHNGAIWCISEPGQGAEFWVEIPIWQSCKLATTSTAMAILNHS